MSTSCRKHASGLHSKAGSATLHGNFKMSMLVLRGAPAFTPARLAKRLRRIQGRNPAIRDAAAEFVHFAEIAEPLSDRETHVLDRLLSYGPRVEAHKVDGQRLLVVPRIGTISPWSSKATDGAHNCGLDKVKRIERGIWHTVAGTITDAPALRAPSTTAGQSRSWGVKRTLRDSSATPSRSRSPPWTCWARAAPPSKQPTRPWGWLWRLTRSIISSTTSAFSAETRRTSS